MGRTDGTDLPPVQGRLGYLLKHAEQRMAALNKEALSQLGIDGRELGVLLALSGQVPPSQQEVAERLSVDRTTMVAFIDGLERKGLVSRQPDPRDRRRNVIELTGAGRAAAERGLRLSDEAEAELLAPLSTPSGKALREALRKIVVEAARSPA